MTEDIAKAKAMMTVVMSDAGAVSFGEHRGWELWHLDLSEKEMRPSHIHRFIALDYKSQARLESFGPGQALAFTSILSKINHQLYVHPQS